MAGSWVGGRHTARRGARREGLLCGAVCTPSAHIEGPSSWRLNSWASPAGPDPKCRTRAHPHCASPQPLP